MIRVLQVLSGLHIGGVQSFVMNYYRHLDKNEIQFDFAVMDENKGEYEDEVLQNGSRVFRIRDIVKSPLGCYKDIVKILKENNEITGIHTHLNFLNIIPILAAKKVKLKKIVSHSHSNYETKSILKKIIRKIVSKIIVKKSTNLIACSQDAGIWLYGKKSVNNKKFIVISNAIDFKIFKNALLNKDMLKNKYNIKNDTINLIHIGSMTYAKNHVFLVELLKELKKTHNNYNLLLIGGGELEQNIQTYAKELGVYDDILFFGWKKNVEDFLAISDIFVFPSLFEGLGIALLEAQASGIDCIISNKISHEAVINDTIVKSINLDVNIWKDYINQIETKNVEKRINSSNMSKTDTYDIDVTVKKLEKIYKE